MGSRAAKRQEAPMAEREIVSELAAHRHRRQPASEPPDSAGSLLCYLLAQARETGDVEVLGQVDYPEGRIGYCLGVKLPGDRELYVEVVDV